MSPVQVSNVTICCSSSGESCSKSQFTSISPIRVLRSVIPLVSPSSPYFKSMSKCCPISLTRLPESECHLIPLMLNEFRQSMVAMPVLKFQPPQDLMLLLPFSVQVVPASPKSKVVSRLPKCLRGPMSGLSYLPSELPMLVLNLPSRVNLCPASVGIS